MADLVQQLMTKMGLHNEPHVLSKTTELVRLLELRAVNVSLQISDYAKIVLCGDLAANLLGVAFDKEQALKLSGLRKSHYANHKRMFEKLLELQKIIGVNEICIQLGLSEVTKKAQELLDLYRKVMTHENADVDMEHPQYAAMACYQAYKIKGGGKRTSKTRFLSFSNLKPNQWLHLEQRWNKLLEKHHGQLKEREVPKQIPEAGQQDEIKTIVETKQSPNAKVGSIEDYEHWKMRILKMAQGKLPMQDQNKENYILEN